MFRRAPLLVLCALFAGMAVGVAGIKVKQALQSSLPPMPITGPGAPQYETEVARQVARSQLLPDGAVLLFGDSHTVALPGSIVAANTENFGINSDTTAGLLARLTRYRLDGAHAVVLAIGFNDLHRQDPAGFGVQYRRLLSMIPPGVSVIAVAVFPAAGLEIAAYNRQINDSCAAVTGCRVLDISGILIGQGGALAAGYADSDGDHLSALGTALWAKALREALDR